jgi:hypothetical protein
MRYPMRRGTASRLAGRVRVSGARDERRSTRSLRGIPICAGTSTKLALHRRLGNWQPLKGNRKHSDIAAGEGLDLRYVVVRLQCRREHAGGCVVRGARAAAAVLLAAGLAGACGDDDGSGAGATDTTAASTETTIATTTTQDPEAEVEAAYLAYWEMNKRLATAPDPDDQEISERASGSARDHLVDSLTTLQAQGRSYMFGPQDRHRVVSSQLDDDMATVRGCAVADASIVEPNGQVRRLEVMTTLLEAQLAHTNERWVVTTVSELRSWDGATTCAT